MEALKQLLIAVSSQDPRGLINAERQLKVLEVQPGFHAALLVCHCNSRNFRYCEYILNDVFQTSASDRELNSGTRLQAILYLKNGIDKYWRKNAPK